MGSNSLVVLQLRPSALVVVLVSSRPGRESKSSAPKGGHTFELQVQLAGCIENTKLFGLASCTPDPRPREPATLELLGSAGAGERGLRDALRRGQAIGLAERGTRARAALASGQLFSLQQQPLSYLCFSALEWLLLLVAQTHSQTRGR